MSSEATPKDLAVLRARDFWGALVLMVLLIFFLWRTFDIPLWGGNRAGVASASWYNSAAIVPLGIFSALLILSIVLLLLYPGFEKPYRLRYGGFQNLQGS